MLGGEVFQILGKFGEILGNFWEVWGNFGKFGEIPSGGQRSTRVDCSSLEYSAGSLFKSLFFKTGVKEGPGSCWKEEGGAWNAVEGVNNEWEDVKELSSNQLPIPPPPPPPFASSASPKPTIAIRKVTFENIASNYLLLQIYFLK